MSPLRLVFLLPLLSVLLRAAAPADYRAETGIVYSEVEGTTQTLNAFLPPGAATPAAAMVYIHGGWWSGGGPAVRVEQVPGAGAFARQDLAIFSISYRLGRNGGFPQNIRDCRNAIRFLRKNAARFNIDPARIGVTGTSAGGHLSLMVALVPEDFDDGGPTPGLERVGTGVRSCFSYIGPTDFVRFWTQGPDDVVVKADGTTSFRGPDNAIPHDSRPRLRMLFHGVTPDTEAHRALYLRLSPMGHVRRDAPPLLICDGEKDPIVPGLHGQVLAERLRAAGADVTYWMTPGGGHAYPGGDGFGEVLDAFLARTLGPPP